MGRAGGGLTTLKGWCPPGGHPSGLAVAQARRPAPLALAHALPSLRPAPAGRRLALSAAPVAHPPARRCRRRRSRARAQRLLRTRRLISTLRLLCASTALCMSWMAGGAGTGWVRAGRSELAVAGCFGLGWALHARRWCQQPWEVVGQAGGRAVGQRGMLPEHHSTHHRAPSPSNYNQQEERPHQPRAVRRRQAAGEGCCGGALTLHRASRLHPV